MWRNLIKILICFFFGIFGGIFADQILWPYFIERPLFYQYRLEQRPVYLTEKREIFIQENTALKDAIEKVDKTIVGIKTKLKSGATLEGSGLIISSDGLVVTLAELVPANSQIKIYWEGENPSFQILKRDQKENLALLKIEKNNLPTAGFFDLEKLKIGERVFLYGIIFDKDVPKKMVNEGIIKYFDENFMRTNIFEKNILAGSPIFDIEGKILGINTIDKEGKVIAIPNKKIKAIAGF